MFEFRNNFFLLLLLLSTVENNFFYVLNSMKYFFHDFRKNLNYSYMFLSSISFCCCIFLILNLMKKQHAMKHEKWVHFFHDLITDLSRNSNMKAKLFQVKFSLDWHQSQLSQIFSIKGNCVYFLGRKFVLSHNTFSFSS